MSIHLLSHQTARQVVVALAMVAKAVTVVAAPVSLGVAAAVVD